MNAHTSLGSQFQYDDHAWCAQMGPVISTANVHTGKPKACSRYETRSSTSGCGSRATYPVVLSEPRALTRYSADVMPPSVNAPVAMIAETTWMTNQYDVNASPSGTTGA